LLQGRKNARKKCVWGIESDPCHIGVVVGFGWHGRCHMGIGHTLGIERSKGKGNCIEKKSWGLTE
jgi:hypothetical protein